MKIATLEAFHNIHDEPDSCGYNRNATQNPVHLESNVPKKGKSGQAVTNRHATAKTIAIQRLQK